jgi:hypothetical protein
LKHGFHHGFWYLVSGAGLLTHRKAAPRPEQAILQNEPNAAMIGAVGV